MGLWCEIIPIIYITIFRDPDSSWFKHGVVILDWNYQRVSWDPLGLLHPHSMASAGILKQPVAISLWENEPNYRTNINPNPKSRFSFLILQTLQNSKLQVLLSHMRICFFQLVSQTSPKPGWTLYIYNYIYNYIYIYIIPVSWKSAWWFQHLSTPWSTSRSSSFLHGAQPLEATRLPNVRGSDARISLYRSMV